MDIDGLLFALTSLATGAEQEWALCLWCREALCFRRFLHLTPGVFQQVKMKAQNTISAAPVGRLLDWHFRISQAHQPRREILQDDPAHSIQILSLFLIQFSGNISASSMC